MLHLETKSLGTVKVSFRHHLPTVKVESNNRLSSSKIKFIQGVTSCRLRFNHQGPGEYYEGFSYTHPDDPYTKSIGRNYSFCRALSQIPNLDLNQLIELMDVFSDTVHVCTKNLREVNTDNVG